LKERENFDEIVGKLSAKNKNLMEDVLENFDIESNEIEHTELYDTSRD